MNAADSLNRDVKIETKLQSPLILTFMCSAHIRTVMQRSYNSNKCLFPIASKKHAAFKQACTWTWGLINPFHLMNPCLICGQQFEV
jgi:hypothetical protein